MERKPKMLPEGVRWLFIFIVLLLPRISCAQVGVEGECVIEAQHAAVDSISGGLQVKGSWENTVADQGDAQYSFRPKQLILPCALFAVGTFGVYNSAFRKLDTDIKNGMDNLRGDCYCRIDDWIQYLPAVTYLTFGSIGIKSKHGFKERVAVEATAYLAMAALVNIGKYSFREKRPDSDARNSFPSGHTATVFTGAELMRVEYGLGLGLASYGVATCVAFLRLYNGRHWLNDVLAGAGLGILSARIGYWMLPLYQKWFGWNKAGDSKVVSILPGYNAECRELSMNVSIMF